MRRFVPRAVLSAALAFSAGACAAGTATSGGSSSGPAASTGGGEGGRVQVMIPTVEATGGAAERDAERLAGRLRGLVGDMATHSVVNPDLVDAAMRQYGVAALDTVTATQLAQQLGAQNVLYTILSPGGSGLSADVRFVDVASGDVIRIDDLSAANANELATTIFGSVQSSIEGMTQAAACNQQLAASQYEQALATCNAAIAVVPTSTQALYGKATALLNLDRDEEALATFRQLLEVEETHQDALLSAGLAASALGQTDEAQEFYNRYMELNPGDPQVRVTVASRIAESGDYVSAFTVLQPAISAEANRANPEFQRFLFGLATAAGGAASTAAREGGATEEDARAASRTYFEAALNAYRAAFASDSVRPDVNQIRQAIAVNTELGNNEEALRIAREATAQYDTVAAVWSQYASALDAAGQHQEAVQAFNRVIQLDPDYENAYIRRGVANLAAGQQQQALADLQQAAQRGNASAVASVLFNEGTRAMNDQRFGDAAGLFEIAAQHGDAQIKPQALFLQGFMLFRQGDAIARANAQGQAAPARQALELFQRARPLVEAGENPSKAQVLQGIDQYIANQEAVIRAGGR